MFQDIQRNKIKSFSIVGLFILIITLILYYVCLAFEFNAPFAITIALGFSIFVSWISYYNSDKIILAVTKARPATIEEDKKIVQILEALMLSSGLSHMPRLYVSEDPQPNAFATRQKSCSFNYLCDHWSFRKIRIL